MEQEWTYTIRAVNGPLENPAQLVLGLTDTGEEAVLSKDKPFRRVDGYMADLKYDPESKKCRTSAWVRVLNLAMTNTLSLPSTRAKWYCPLNRTRKKQHCRIISMTPRWRQRQNSPALLPTNLFKLMTKVVSILLVSC